MMADPALAYLKKRGFIIEERDRSWPRYHEPIWRVPVGLAELLLSELKGAIRTLETQLSLKSHVRTLSSQVLESRLARLGFETRKMLDRSQLADDARARDACSSRSSRSATNRSGPRSSAPWRSTAAILERGQLERLGLLPADVGRWRDELESLLLGTILDSDFARVGLLLKPGSLIIFHEVVRSVLGHDIEPELDEPPEPPGDVIADLSRIRAFLDNHSVRATREGTLYRATARKMEAEVLTPGARAAPPEEVLIFLLEFLFSAGLLRVDDDQRLRPRPTWKDFDDLTPAGRGDQLLRFVGEDLRDTKAEFHHPKLRRIFLAKLKEAGAERWIDLRHLAHLARNQYLAALDHDGTAERFQRRYQYTPIPPLVLPSVITRELVQFGSRLALAGLAEISAPPQGRTAIRLTKLGLAVLGLVGDALATAGEGGLIVTADFEIVVFPDALDFEALHKLGRFARREKADVTIHFRLSERSVQEAVVAGASIDELFALLNRHARYAIPQNVSRAARRGRSAVTVMEVRRTILLKAPSKAALDNALKVRELRAIAGERLSDTALELNEDPTATKIAEALRAEGFFLRYSSSRPAALLAPVYRGKILDVDRDKVELPGGMHRGPRDDPASGRRRGRAAASRSHGHADPPVPLRRRRLHPRGRRPASSIPASRPSPARSARSSRRPACAPARLHPLGWIFTTPGFTDEKIHLFAGDGPRARDAGPRGGRGDRGRPDAARRGPAARRRRRDPRLEDALRALPDAAGARRGAAHDLNEKRGRDSRGVFGLAAGRDCGELSG